MHKRSNILLFCVIVVAMAIYWPSLKGGFFFDDLPNIVDNPAVHLTSFSFAGLQESLSGLSAGPLGRPLSVASFALTHLFFGLDPIAFKTINLTIHLINGLLAAWLVSLLLSVLPLHGLTNGMRRWLPVWVAAAWLWHPVHFVAINMAVQRMTLLAALFTMLGLIAHLKGSLSPGSRWVKWRWLLLAWVVCWPLAVLSKETGLLFPAFVLLIEVFSRPSCDQDGRKSLVWPFAAIALVGVAMYSRIGLSWLEAGYAVRDFTLVERLMTEARVLWFYLSQILLPSHGAFAIYLDGFSVSRSLFEPPWTIFSIVAWVLVIVVAGFYHRWPMLSFGLLWFLVGHSLESTVVPLEIAHEHRNYLPALGPLLAAGYYGARLLSRLRVDRPVVLSTAVALASLSLLALLTALRSAQMADPVNGAQMEAIRHENSARANYAAAWGLFKAGLGDKDDPMGGTNIRFFFEQAERADPSFKLGYLGLVIWSCASGRSVEGHWLTEFAERLEYTPFSHGQMPLPGYLLKPLVAMPNCLSRAEVLGLFEAGSRNSRAGDSLRAAFLEAAGEYELVVTGNPEAAQVFYLRASTLDPNNLALKGKVKALSVLP